MVLTHIITWLYERFSHLLTPTKYQYLTRITFFDTSRVGFWMKLLVIAYCYIVSTYIPVQHWFTYTFSSGCRGGLSLYSTTPASICAFTHSYSFSWRVDLSSPIGTRIGGICVVETNNLWILVERLFKRNCLLQISSIFQPWNFFPVPYSN